MFITAVCVIFLIKTDTVLEKGSNDKVARHREALRKIVANIEDLHLDIEKSKLEAAKSIEDVKAWGGGGNNRTNN